LLLDGAIIPTQIIVSLHTLSLGHHSIEAASVRKDFTLTLHYGASKALPSYHVLLFALHLVIVLYVVAI
jgi:hypothetical protein